LGQPAPERKLTCINRSSTSNLVSRKDDREEIPPLLMRMSIVAKVWVCVAIWRHSALTDSNASLSRPLRMSKEGWQDASACASDHPRPRDAPVSSIALFWYCSWVALGR
ncbi:hypothetical protein HJC23_005493, partial [Cyclotella cryptica]